MARSINKTYLLKLSSYAKEKAHGIGTTFLIIFSILLLLVGKINENSLNNKLKDIIKNLKIGRYSDPQTIPGGFLIIKLNDINNKKVSINMKKELNNLIKLKTNQQLNQFSNIYFNKIKKNIKIEKI